MTQKTVLIRSALSKSWFYLEPPPDFYTSFINSAADMTSLFVCISVASLRSTQEEYQRKALGAFQRSLFSLLHPHSPPSHCATCNTAFQFRLVEHQPINPLYFLVYCSFICAVTVETLQNFEIASYFLLPDEKY